MFTPVQCSANPVEDDDNNVVDEHGSMLAIMTIMMAH